MFSYLCENVGFHGKKTFARIQFLFNSSRTQIEISLTQHQANSGGSYRECFHHCRTWSSAVYWVLWKEEILLRRGEDLQQKLQKDLWTVNREKEKKV